MLRIASVSTIAVVVAFLSGCAVDPADPAGEESVPGEQVNEPTSEVEQQLADAKGEPDPAGPIEIQASSTCFVGSSGTCTTAVVAANASSHSINIGINNRLRPSPCSFRVRDAVNRVVIFSGQVGVNSSFSRHITGVFSLYQLELFSCTISARGDINNN